MIKILRYVRFINLIMVVDIFWLTMKTMKIKINWNIIGTVELCFLLQVLITIKAKKYLIKVHNLWLGNVGELLGSNKCLIV